MKSKIKKNYVITQTLQEPGKKADNDHISQWPRTEQKVYTFVRRADPGSVFFKNTDSYNQVNQVKRKPLMAYYKSNQYEKYSRAYYNYAPVIKDIGAYEGQKYE